MPGLSFFLTQSRTECWTYLLGLCMQTKWVNKFLCRSEFMLYIGVGRTAWLISHEKLLPSLKHVCHHYNFMNLIFIHLLCIRPPRIKISCQQKKTEVALAHLKIISDSVVLKAEEEKRPKCILHTSDKMVLNWKRWDEMAAILSGAPSALQG